MSRIHYRLTSIKERFITSIKMRLQYFCCYINHYELGLIKLSCYITFSSNAALGTWEAEFPTLKLKAID